MEGVPREEDYECPICTHLYRAACDTSCGHTFCAPCFLEWASRKPDTPADCPLCRRPVTAVLPSEARVAVRDIIERKGRDPRPDAVSADTYFEPMVTYNSRFSEVSRPLETALREEWVGLNRLLTAGSLMWRGLLIVLSVAVCLYILLPFDLIPDYYGVVGFLDDLGALITVLYVMVIIVDRFRHATIAAFRRRVG